MGQASARKGETLISGLRAGYSGANPYQWRVTSDSMEALRDKAFSKSRRNMWVILLSTAIAQSA